MGLHNDDNPVEGTTTSEKDREAIKLRFANSLSDLYTQSIKWCRETQNDESKLIEKITKAFLKVNDNIDRPTRTKELNNILTRGILVDEIQKFVMGTKSDLNRDLIISELHTKKEDEVDKIIQWAYEERNGLVSRDSIRSVGIQRIMTESDNATKEYIENVDRSGETFNIAAISKEGGELKNRIDAVEKKDKKELEIEDFKIYCAGINLIQQYCSSVNKRVKKRFNSPCQKQEKSKSVDKTIDLNKSSRKPKTNVKKQSRITMDKRYRRQQEDSKKLRTLAQSGWEEVPIKASHNSRGSSNTSQTRRASGLRPGF